MKTSSKVLLAQSVAQGGTLNVDLDCHNFVRYSAQINKTGVGQGTAKLQWSLDGSNWVDITSQSQTITTANGLYLVWNLADLGPGHVRLNIVESGTAAITVDVYVLAKAN